ncbi:hypothetical protein T484DRAFT_1884777 [Baffinella frigidus]|nr:hypothetical protein T484DRAFT_1884777 [Cryptophyta sp. CCMP2293]
MVAITQAPVARVRVFPSPLNTEMVRLALMEVSDGQRLSTEQCVKCWQDKRLSDDDLLQTFMMLCDKSSVLRHAFKKTHRKHSDLQETASADDLMFLLSMSDAPAPLQRTSSSGSSAPPMLKPAFVWGAAVVGDSKEAEVAFDGTAKKKVRPMSEGEPRQIACH